MPLKEQSYSFRHDLRRLMIFTQYNLLQDAPISKVDLLVCRNTLIYFNDAGQVRALLRFHFGLKDSGFLVLGSTKMANIEPMLPLEGLAFGSE